MFSLLAIVVTVLLLGSAMLWRGIRALWRSNFGPRALGSRRWSGGPGVLERAAAARGPLQTPESADRPVASSGVPRRW